jgi:hypothetical protein
MEIEDDRPRCMDPNCKKIWSWDFLAENTRTSFHNGKYRKRRAYLLYQREKALLPGTQGLVEREKSRIKSNKKILVLQEEIDMFRHIINQKKREVNNLRYAIENLNSTNSEIKSPKIFNMACTVTDCRGFLSSSWKCGTCDTHVCKHCHVPKSGHNDPDHKCDKNLVATLKLLKKDTKACPSCKTAIYKINGCDQMYCTQCHTAFSWKKGTIERGVIHNPHFYEYQRRQNGGTAPRINRGFGCGGIVNGWELEEHLTRLLMKESIIVGMYHCHRWVTHTREVELPRYPFDIGDRDNSRLRVSYLLKHICEDKWKQCLRHNMKKQEKNSEIHQILDMYTTSAADIFRNIMDCGDKKSFMENFKAMHSLREYTNESLQNISRRFGNVSPGIDASFKFWSNYKTMLKRSKHISINSYWKI